MNKIKWYDSRCIKPHCQYYCYYLCMFGNNTVIVKDGYECLVRYEIVGWNPKNNFTDGEWDCENPNEVLYWTFLDFNLPEGLLNE